jgi:bifunctional non-homologous end joining protein LigD
MLKSPFEPCIPSDAKSVPDRPEWIHEIKHDGYRLIIQRDGKRVRLWTRNGHDWSDRFPLITEAAQRNRNSFVIDGEAVLLGEIQFSGLHSRRHDNEVQFYAFDILVNDGQNVRQLPLSMRGRPGMPPDLAAPASHHWGFFLARFSPRATTSSTRTT